VPGVEELESQSDQSCKVLIAWKVNMLRLCGEIKAQLTPSKKALLALLIGNKDAQDVQKKRYI
jgi:hypothetical protein